MLKGAHLIAGEWVGGDETFENAPVEGTASRFAVGTPELVDRAAQAAEAAFDDFVAAGRGARAALLDAIADEIDARGDAITEIGCAETGLPAGRLEGERGRTTGQLRLFAAHVRDVAHLDIRRDDALPDRTPAPRPDLRVMQRPIGPVAVFGASNFPLAFSVAGGDTASALAAGCPVVVKGHEAHPGVSDLVAQAIDAAVRRSGAPSGVFSLVQGGGAPVGQALARHPLIKAVGFTGSLGAGRALFDLCAARPEPIPFFGELGSINPMFLAPAALAARGGDIAAGWAGSLTLGVGQFCTNPGVAVALAGADADQFAASTVAALQGVGPGTMLTAGIAANFSRGRDRLAAVEGVETLLAPEIGARTATPALYRAPAARFLATQDLAHEVFGPLGILLIADSIDEMVAVARGLEGQLTACLHLDAADAGDLELAGRLAPTLERKAGRILANGYPTGVEVADAMVHGGPYPASTNFGHTSVGTLSIRRWLRPVCYQNLPEALLPLELT